MSASEFRDTPVRCIAFVPNEDSTEDMITGIAKLYVYGKKNPNIWSH